jgi:hypothetical protein
MTTFVSKDGSQRLSDCMGMRNGSFHINGVDVFDASGNLSKQAVRAGWYEEPDKPSGGVKPNLATKDTR